jgi:hypothetical protein
MNASIRRFLGTVTLVFVSLIAAFGVGELLVRVLYKDETVLFPRYHTAYRYGPYTIRGIRPNSEFWHTSVDGSWRFVTNSNGFRNAVDIQYEKAPGVYRVLSLGDSHTQGYEVRQEATFTAVLERALGARYGKVEAINAGVSGFSTAEALAFLENEGIKYAPDAVVLGFFANDFEDNLKARLFGLDGQGRLTEERFEHVPGVRIQNFIYSIPLVQWLGERSYFYSLLFNTVWNFFKARLGQEAAEVDGKRLQDAGARDDIEYAVPTSANYSEHQVALAAALIERMDRFCKSRGIRLIVVDIPNRPAVYRFDSSLPPPLVERLAAGGIEYLNSDRVFADFDGAAELHVPHGHHHISELAHGLIGINVARRLVEPGKPAAQR